MKRKKREQKKPVLERGLEWYLEHFHEKCEVCHQPMTVNYFRQGNFRWKKAVFAACFNKSCRNHYLTVCYYLKGGEDNVCDNP